MPTTPLSPDVPRPVIQLCIDVTDIDAAASIATMGLAAGVDWIEFGTPLISFVGVNNLGGLASRLDTTVTFLDAKVMDGSARYVEAAGRMGVKFVCLCASASDATFRAAIRAANANGVVIVGDLYAVSDPIARGKQLTDLGIGYLYLHYGFDEQTEAPGDNPTLSQLEILKIQTGAHVGIVCPDADYAEKAAKLGADILLVSHPYLIGDGVDARLRELVTRAKVAGARPSGF